MLPMPYPPEMHYCTLSFMYEHKLPTLRNVLMAELATVAEDPHMK